MTQARLLALVHAESIICKQPISPQRHRLIDINSKLFSCTQTHDDVNKSTTTSDSNKKHDRNRKMTDVNQQQKGGSDFAAVFGIVAPIGIGLMMFGLVLTVHCKKTRPLPPSYELWILKSMSYGSLKDQQSLSSVAETASVGTTPSIVTN